MRYRVPMAGKRKNGNVCWTGAERLDQLLADRGWTPRDLARESESTGHPLRSVSARVVYRVINEGHKPTRPLQFEIAAAFGLLPSHVWGPASVPALEAVAA